MSLLLRYPFEYQSWQAMKQRCYNPKNANYHSYGGRGITVCARWLKSFANFMKDMGPKQPPAVTLERINVNGNYEPKNCRWATKFEQTQNKRPSHVFRLPRLQARCPHLRKVGIETGWYCLDCAKLEPHKNL